MKQDKNTIHAYKACLPEDLRGRIDGYTCLKIAQYFLDQYSKTHETHYEEYAEKFLNIGTDTYHDEECQNLLIDYFGYVI